MANTTIVLKKSGVSGNVPSVLANGEISINYADGKLFYRAANGTITSISGSSSGGSANSFATINANSSLILATSNNDTLSIVPGNNISFTTNTTTKSITIHSNTSSGGGTAALNGFSPNTVITANSTGYLSNTTNLNFFTSNNNLVITGNIIAGGVRTTTSSSAPTNATVGDIWYETTSDIIYRYTYDGSGNYWLDITSPTVSVNTATSGSSGGGAVASGVIYENSQNVASNYTITAGKNAMSAGPITINTGVTVTIPTGSRWVIV